MRGKMFSGLIAALGLLFLWAALISPVAADGVEVSRYDFVYYYSDGSGDYYTGYVFAPTSFQTCLTVGSTLTDEPESMGGASLENGYYYITNVTSGCDSFYDKQSYITGYYDADTAGESLGVNSDASSAAGAVYVSDRTTSAESGYAFKGDLNAVFDPNNEIDVFSMFTDTYLGVDYGPFHQENENTDSYISTSQLDADFQIISQKFKYVKIYTLNNGLDQVPAEAQKYGLKVILGVEEHSTDSSSHASSADSQAQLTKAINLANTYDNVVGIVVGNECLSGDSQHASNYISDDALVADLKTAYNGLSSDRRKSVFVTTDLSWAAADGSHGTYLRNNASDYIGVWMINIYPWYAGPNGTNCTAADIEANLNWNYDHFTSSSEYGNTGKTIVVGETGWPSAGSNNGQSVASVDNEKTYTNTASSWLKSKGWSAFFFEMFDEPWKTNEGDVGVHWGLYNGDGTAKFDYTNPTY